MTDTMTTPPASRELPLEPGGSVDIVLAASDLRDPRDRRRPRHRPDPRRRPAGRQGPASRPHPASSGSATGRGASAWDRSSCTPGRSPDLDIDLPRTAAITLRTRERRRGGRSGSAGPAGGRRRPATCGSRCRPGRSSWSRCRATRWSRRRRPSPWSGGRCPATCKVRAPRLDGLDASTTSGDVRVEADLAAGSRHASAPSRATWMSSRAARSASRPRRSPATSGRTARTATEGGRGRRTLVVGNGSVGLSVRTTSGDVRLRVMGGLGSTGSGRPAGSGPAAPAAPRLRARPARLRPPRRLLPPRRPLRFPCCRWHRSRPGRSRSGLPSPRPSPRPIGDDDTQAWNAPEPAIDRREAERLGVLRALERGDLDVETASRRLEALDEAGPRSFRGWC